MGKSYEQWLHDPHDPVEAQPNDRWWGWLAVAIAIGVYELSADPALSAMIVCGRFGWDYFLNARWLRVMDPVASRGRVCFWFYLAMGLWRICAIATIVAIIILTISIHVGRAFGRPGLPLKRLIVGAGFEALAGFLLASFMALWAVFLARRLNHYIWIDSRVTLARRANDWPTAYCRRNSAMGLIAVAAVFTAISTLVTCLVLFGFLCMAIFPRVGPAGAFITSIVLLTLLLVGVVFSLIVAKSFERVARSIVAPLPLFCWGENRNAPPPQLLRLDVR